MRQSVPVTVLVMALIEFTSSINAANGTERDGKMRRTLQDGRKETTNSLVIAETEERRFKIPGLSKLSSLFKKNPKIGNAIASNPSITDALKDPKVAKTITTLKGQPGFLEKLRRTSTYKEIAPKLRTNSLTQSDIEHLGEETVKASGKKGYMYDMVFAAAATIVGLVAIALVSNNVHVWGK
ncbi:hypothetical protein PHYSODRAFT_286091 [Phytophthora sojae]|uniref:RxLR effector protein n=2 Tax=Phytophthora sojae TaxID=67593 RepID=G4ZGD6_PHYSP|nr:hypothetical protein PHYSODRAFT_286091 [Phytophthora sojae]AEK80709.1 Avh125 [Phytophthora sojae]AEK80710.1 Avh125 [Phytophthora sojae]EGZ18581.1 hypothetical protein PHYSODRAFT_286091 [Phytophthora sojae]|eukprot:XP_009527639.1 hypothetical protein PHYSODRAFT_286091 [Phytophthora sojae]